MFTRESQTEGVSVEWNPEDEDLAAQAMANVTGSPPQTPEQARENAAVDLGEKRDTARKVREEHARLLKEKEASN